ncbi:MAG: cardiolipin synthase [Lachnospiraceae bacterium]|nr:cardiolipin synthase [Lachnospiraceae bacterium]
MSSPAGKRTEEKAHIRNGVMRLSFAALAVLLDIGLIILLLTTLNKAAEWINIITRIVTVIVVITIFNKNRPSAIKTGWIILIMVSPILGVTMYALIDLSVTTKAMRRRFAEMDKRLYECQPDTSAELASLYETDPVAAGICRYLKTSAGYPLYRSTDVRYFDSAAKGLEAQLADMARAQHFIFLEYHAIEEKESWNRILSVLKERSDSGVEVRIIYDDVGSIGFIDTDFVRRMQALGLKCRVFNPVLPALRPFLNNRDHRKITVIDGRIGFTGGYNLANEYFNITHPYGLWKDTGIRLQGEAVRSLTSIFLEMWNAVSRKGEDDADLKPFFPKDPIPPFIDSTGYCQPYADSPLDDERVGENVYISMVEKAEHYCYFMTPYLIPSDDLQRALSLAAKRGVDVRIITPGIPDKKAVYTLTRSYYHDLTVDGVRIFEWAPGFCHAKMCVVDDHMATCGTINLDFRSLYHHFENGCLIVGDPVILTIKNDFDRTFTECHEVTAEYKAGRGKYIKFSHLLVRLMAPLL